MLLADEEVLLAKELGVRIVFCGFSAYKLIPSEKLTNC